MIDAPIDMSFRLWSDEIALEPVVLGLGLPLRVLHVRGEPVPPHKGAQPRMAPRHYASAASRKGRLCSDVDAWAWTLRDRVQSDRPLYGLIQTGQIEATLWVTILGKGLMSNLRVDPRAIECAASLGIRVLIENYTELENGNPSRCWLPKKSAKSAKHAHA